MNTKKSDPMCGMDWDTIRSCGDQVYEHFRRKVRSRAIYDKALRLIGPENRKKLQTGQIPVRNFIKLDYDRRSSRMIHGPVTTLAITSNGNFAFPMGCQLAVPIPLLFAHQEGQVGEVVYMRRSEGEVYVRAIIFDNELGNYVWGLIKKGEVTGFSAGYETGKGQFHVNTDIDGVKFFDKFRYREISVTRDPANDEARFKIYSDPDRYAKAREVVQKNQPPGLSHDEQKRFYDWYNKKRDNSDE